jgi:hypothetical protein
MLMEMEQADFGDYAGSAAGMPTEEKWLYSSIGYNATDGIFYVGEEQVKELSIIPFAVRQCKQVEDAAGVTHRYPIKTPRNQMIEGDITSRLQVLCVVNGELHVFGAKSWTARAAFMNPRGGPYSDSNFEAGIWWRLLDYIKQVKNEQGKTTAPFCYEIELGVGDEISLSSAANAKQKAKTHPIVAKKMRFVGPELAQLHEKLYIEEEIDDWVNEWNKAAVTEAVEESNGHAPAVAVKEDEHIPF